MSTKVYNGFRFDSTNLETVLRVVESFQPVIRKSAEAMMDIFVDAYGDGLWHRSRRDIKVTGHRNPSVDTEFSLLFLPYQGRLYGIGYTEHQLWFDAWLSQPLVSEYAYWNNTDKPVHLTEYDWDERMRVWDTLFALNPIPAMRGFSIRVDDPNGPYPKGWTRDIVDKLR